MFPNTHKELVDFLTKNPFVECIHPQLGKNVLRFINADKHGCWFKDEKESNRFVPTNCVAILLFKNGSFVLSMPKLEVNYYYLGERNGILS